MLELYLPNNDSPPLKTNNKKQQKVQVVLQLREVKLILGKLIDA